MRLLRAPQKVVAGRMWPAGRSLPTPGLNNLNWAIVLSLTPLDQKDPLLLILIF